MMADREEVKDVGADPEYITYLLNIAEHKTYFFVGEEKTKIGAVKLMLAAHSDVLRSELLDSPIAEKGNVYLEDISPRTFKNLLRYVYGFNNVSNLSFDEADDLLYAADKYLIKNLKAQLALRLMDLLDCQNICSLLNNPACHTVLELDAKITEILQYETEAVFDCPDFINLRVEGFIKILEQDTLVVSELEVWIAALKWAKNKARTEDGSILRILVSELKHIRIRTFTHEEICKEVVLTNVLSEKEVFGICASYGKGEPVPIIEGFSDKTHKRQLIINEANLSVVATSTSDIQSSSFTITPKKNLLLLPLEFIANRAQSSSTDYQCECTIEIMPNSFPDQKETVKFNQKVNCEQTFKVPLPAKCRRLTSNNSYKITITFNVPHRVYASRQEFTCENVYLQPNSYLNSGYVHHFRSLKYAKLPLE